MPTSVKVNDLKINRLTEAQYDAAVQAGVIGENELSIITDLEAGQVIQVDTLPTASADELDKIYQYIGTTDQNYTNGYFYKCVSDGQSPATYSWERVDVQPAPVIPDPLPSQSGNTGKFLTTNGTDASWGTTIANTLNINLPSGNFWPLEMTGPGGTSTCTFTLASGSNSASTYLGVKYNGSGANFIYTYDKSTLGHKNLCFYAATNSSVDETYLGNSSKKWTIIYGTKLNNGGDIAIPTSSGTMVVTDYTSATQGQILTLDANGNAIWANPASPVVTPQTMPELTVNGWTTDPNTGDITQTVTVQGVTATNTVFVSPYPTSTTDYADAGIICITQSTNSLTFKCTTQPSNAITVNVLII